jgi:hypothetical protein
VTKQDVRKLCFKLFGIYTFINAIAYGGSVLASALTIAQPSYELMQGGASTQVVILPFTALLLFCLSAILWFGAEAFTERIFSKNETTESPIRINPEIIKQIAFMVAGILILAGALPHLAGPITSLLIPKLNNTSAWVDLAMTIIRIVLGIWLIFGSARICNFFKLGAEKIGNLHKTDW